MQGQEDIVVGLDIGTTKICAVVGAVAGKEINIIGIGTHPSIGLRKGVVVDIESTVESIKKAIEEIYGVKVHSVNIIIVPGKKKRVRREMGHTIDWKKAVVTLKEDQKIEVT